MVSGIVPTPRALTLEEPCAGSFLVITSSIESDWVKQFSWCGALGDFDLNTLSTRIRARLKLRRHACIEIVSK